jgi:hypothetical protein
MAIFEGGASEKCVSRVDEAKEVNEGGDKGCAGRHRRVEIGRCGRTFR